MTSTQYVDEAAETAQSTINRATDVWKQGTEVLAKQADLWSVLPWVDPVKGVERYFEFVQTAVDANRELAISWADAMGSVYGVVRDGAESISRLGADQADQLADKAADTGKELTEQAASGARTSPRRPRRQLPRPPTRPRAPPRRPRTPSKTQRTRPRTRRGGPDRPTPSKSARIADPSLYAFLDGS